MHIIKTRLANHILFWIFILLLMLAFIPSNITNSSKIPNDVLCFFALRDIVLVVVVYYGFTQVVYTQILKKNYILGIFWAISLYFLLVFGQIISKNLYDIIENKDLLYRYHVFSFRGKTFIDKILNPHTHWTTIYWYILYFFIAFSLKTLKEINRFKEQKLNLETENLNFQFLSLKNEFNPDLILSVLEKLKGDLKAKSPLASNILEKMASLLDYSLIDAKNETLPLSKEIKFIQEYIDLERVRHTDKVKINFKLLGDAFDLKIPPLILITFVENAFKHGINKTVQASWVDVKLEILEKTLYFTVKNSVPKNLKKADSGGIGLLNVKKRLDLLYKDQYALTFETLDDTFEINLSLNLEN